MNTFIRASALCAGLVLPASALAQDGQVDTDSEMAACAAVGAVIEIMLEEITSHDQWIDNNRPRSGASPSTYENFNERVGKRNGINEVASRLINDYNSQCTQNIIIATRERLCSRPTDRMRAYLYDSGTCQRHRASRN